MSYGCATLDRVDGVLTVTEAHAVVEGIDLHGELVVKAPGVVVRDSVIRGGPPILSGQNALINVTHPDAVDFRCDRVTLVPEYPNVRQNAVYVSRRARFTRMDVSGTVDGFVIYGDDVWIEDSWLHDFATYASDPAQGGKPSHSDGIQIQAGKRVRVVGNRIEGANNAAIMITQDAGATGDLLIDGNYLDGGGATINFGSKGAAKTNLVVTNNRFGPNRRNSGMAILRNPTQSPLIEFGNVWDADGSPVKVSRGA